MQQCEVQTKLTSRLLHCRDILHGCCEKLIAAIEGGCAEMPRVALTIGCENKRNAQDLMDDRSRLWKVCHEVRAGGG